MAPSSAARPAAETVVVPVTASVTPGPSAMSAPPVIVRPPLIVELAATDSEPPLIEIGSVLVNDPTAWAPDEITMVGLPLRLIVT